jgi:hypothetical protein
MQTIAIQETLPAYFVELPLDLELVLPKEY